MTDQPAGPEGTWIGRPAEGSTSFPPPTAPVAPGCQICGRGPATQVSFKSNVGMLFRRTHRTTALVACRTCGISLFRREQSRTLLTGWWGIVSFFVNIGTVFSNIGQRNRLTKLAEPSGQQTAPALEPGRPVWQSAGALVTAGLIALASFGIYSSATHSDSDDFAGECVSYLTATNSIKVVDCGDPHDGKVIKVVDVGNACPAAATTEGELKTDLDHTLCIDETQ